MNTSLVLSRQLLALDPFSHRCGLHPDLVRRFVDIGLIEPARRVGGDLWFSSIEVTRVIRMQRLRNDFALNYNALGLVLDLLDRIDQLEHAPFISVSSRTGENVWIPDD